MKHIRSGWFVAGAALAVASFVTAQIAGAPWKPAGSLPTVKGKQAIMVQVRADGNRTLTMRYSIPDLQMVETVVDPADGRRTRLTLGNAPLSGNQGEPVMPVIPVQFIIPVGKEIDAISVTGAGRQSLSLPFALEYGSAPVPLMPNAKYAKAVPKATIYSSDNAFPAQNYRLVSVQSKRGIQIGIVNLLPVAYFPKAGRVEYSKEFEIKVTFKSAANAGGKPLRLRTTRQDLKKLGVENPDAIEDYRSDDVKPHSSSSPMQALLDPAESFQYVVITSEAIRTAATDVTINDLVSFRRSLGLTTTLVTIENILTDYAGIDNAERVRNFIIDAYTNWETEYVVLGGDVNIIPIRDLYSDGDSIHSDLYYQCLDGSFNGDGDRFWGEPDDGDDGGDIDLFAEVNVGRISAETPEEMSNAVFKILAYERDNESEGYLRSSCLVGEVLGDNFGPGEFGFAHPYMNELRNGSSTAGYTTAGFVACPTFAIDSLDDFDAVWPVDSLINRINADKYSIINHLGHSNTGYVMKMTNDQADRLTNSKFPFVFTQGCFPGDLTVDCIAEHLTTSTRHGIFAGVFNSNFGFGGYNESYENLDGPSQRIHRQFWDAYLSESIYNLGAINADSHEDNVWNINGTRIRWCIYETNLFGDPYTVVRGQTQGPNPVFKAATVDDRSGGNGDGIINPGERFNLALSLRNIGNGAAGGVSATLNINDPYITIVNRNASFGDMPCCGVIKQSGTNAAIEVSAGCPTPYAFPITLEITDNSGNGWVQTFTLTAHTSYTISGRVLTLTGSTPVANAAVIVNGLISGRVTTNAAGEYRFAGIEGAYSVLAQAAGYLPIDAVHVVLPPNAVNIDFLVSRPQISVNPASISRLLAVNDSVEIPLTIANNGDAVLNFTIAANENNPASEPRAANKRYSATHFVKQKKGVADNRIGNTVALGSGGPDAFGYRWADSEEPGGPAYEWNDISATGELLPAVSNCDDCYEQRSLSFRFPFYGVDFSSVFISSNGYLTFGEGSSQLSNYPLPSVEAPANLVAAFHDDLFPVNGGDIYFQDFGTYAVVQFDQVACYDSSGSVTFQIVISRNGTIVYYYNNLPGSASGITAGIQNGTRDDGLTVVYNAPYLKNQLAVRLRPTKKWLTVAPREGTIPASGSMQLTVKLNSAELMGGEYTGALQINHNDPQHPGLLTVPAALSVDGFKSLTVNPGSISFGNLWLGLRDTMPLTLTNTGTQSTVVSAITSDNPIFTVNAAPPLRVRPGQQVTVNVMYAPQVLGPSSANLTVTSDAEDNSTITVGASAVATQGPDAELTPLAMMFDLGPKDAPADQTAFLANVGGDVLSYRTVIRQGSKPTFAAGTGAAAQKKVRTIERLVYSPYNYQHKFATDRVIVAFNEGKNGFANLSLAAQLGNGKMRELAAARIPKKGIRAYSGKNLFLVALANSSRDGVLEAIRLIRKDINVAYVEPDYQVKFTGVPDDPLFARQYALNNSGQTGGRADADIDAVEGWDNFTGENSDVILGMIDSGIDYLHPDLVANIWTNTGETPGNGIDDDGNGFIDDIHGYDFADNDNDPMDELGHGTHCSGIAAARGNDATGVCGASWGAKLMALRLGNGDDPEEVFVSYAINALAYANAMGATITSNSWGVSVYSQALYDLIAVSGLFVAAAGNDGSDIDQYPMYPAAFDLDNIISVAASDHNDELAYFSNRGSTTVDLAAPGVDILSCIPGNGHEAWSGTSMAAPLVAGCAVLLKTYNPMVTAVDLKEAIMRGVDVMPALEGMTVSGGRLNLAGALKSVNPPWIVLAPQTPGSIDARAGRQFTVTANPKGLLAGTWIADVVFKTDDPFNPDHILTVTANIAPCRSLRSASETFAFNTVWATRDTEANVVLVNDCNSPVTVSSFAFTNAVFTSTQTAPFIIRPFGRFNLPVRFSPLVAGKYDASVTFASDAEDNPTLTVGLSGKSVTPPIITVSPTAIDRTMAFETIQNVPVMLSNTGGADFQFRTKTVPPPRGASGPRAELGEAVLYAALEDNTIRKMNPETGDFIGIPIAKPVINRIGPEGLAYDGVNLYYAASTPRVIVINASTGVIVDSIDCQVGDVFIDGLGVTNDYLILGDYYNERVFVCDKATGNVVAQWSVSGFMGGLGASESRQSVFLANYEYNSVEEHSLLDGTLLNSFETRYGGMGVGFSEAAHVLFVVSPLGGVTVFDPDNGTELAAWELEGCWALAADEAGESLKWLQADVTEGTVPAGKSLTFNATFNSARKLPGTYAAALKIEHRRPIAPGPFTIGCTMTVLPEKRCAAMPASLSYTDTWVGRTDTLPIRLVNTGNAETNVASIVSSNTVFVPFTTTPFTIPPFDSVMLPVGFTPRKAATATGNLTVKSDAAKSPKVTVSLRGVALNPPKICYTPDRVTRTMLPGAEQQSTIELKNTGGADYRFNVSVESIDDGSTALAGAKLIGINWQGIYNLDPATGALLSSVSGQYVYGPSAFDGQHLYVSREWTDSINVIDPATGAIVRSLRLAGNPAGYITEIGVNERYLFSLTPSNGDSGRGTVVSVVDKKDGTPRFSWPVEGGVEGICNGKDAGTLFIYNFITHQLETRRIETGEIITTVAMPEYGYSLTYSRKLDALYMSSGYNVTVINPATGIAGTTFTLPDYMNIAADEAGGVSWLASSVDASEVVARRSSSLVMTFNTARMFPGTYRANVVITHYKGWTPGPFRIPFELTVLPIKKMAVVPGSLDFGSVWIGKDSTRTLTLTNDGNATTTVYSIANLNKAFTFDPPSPFTVGPYSSVQVNAKFTPANNRGMPDVAGVISDAIDLPLRIIRLAGSGVNPPAITVNPKQFTVQLAAGGASRETLRLTNTGGAEYAFSVSGNDLTPGSGGVLYIGQENRILQLNPETFEAIGDPILADSSSYVEGLAWDGRYLYVPKSDSGSGVLILKINPQNPADIDTIRTDIRNGWISGLGVSGDMLLAMDSDYNSLYFLDKATGATTRTVDTYGYGAVTAAAARESYFVFNWNNWNIEEFNLADGSFKNRFPAPTGFDYPTGAAFSNAANALYLCTYSGTIFKLNPDSGAVISTHATNFYEMYAMAADEAVSLPKWLSVSTQSGTVPVKNALDIGIMFDAVEMRPGSFSGEIKITPLVSGAPGPFTIPCNLSVSEGEAARR